MLILGRKVGERIILRNRSTGQTIAIVHVHKILNSKDARIAIDASVEDVEVLREELITRKANNNGGN